MPADARERVLTRMKGDSTDRPPVAIFSQSATAGMMAVCGTSWPSAHGDPLQMAVLGAAQADIFGFECVRAPFGITGEAERLGCGILPGGRSKRPVVTDYAYKLDPLMSKFDDPSVLMSPEEFVSGGKPAVAQGAVGILKKYYGEDYPVVSGNAGTLTLTGMLVNPENLVFGIVMAPDEVQRWLKVVSPLVAAYTAALFDAGADIVQCSEPISSGDWMTKDIFENTCGRYVFFTHCPDHARDRYTELHVCGNSLPIVDALFGTGVSGVSIGDVVQPSSVADLAKGREVVIGNIGIGHPLMSGTPDQVEAVVEDCMNEGFDVIAPGCGLHPDTPDDNLRAMVRKVTGEDHEPRSTRIPL